MSELDSYLLLTLGCSICGLFIGMGNALEDSHEQTHDKQRSDSARIAFLLAPVVGTGYLIAWLVVSDQPLLKLIPVFALAAMSGFFGGFMTRNGIGPWLPMVGVVLMPLIFHATRYFSLTG